jgi:hypothetical protein
MSAPLHILETVLTEARTLLGDSGELWIQLHQKGTHVYSPYHRCVLAAIYDTVHDHPARWDHRDLFAEALELFSVRNHLVDIPKWNDYEGRTFAQVDHAFKVATRKADLE